MKKINKLLLKTALFIGGLFGFQVKSSAEGSGWGDPASNLEQPVTDLSNKVFVPIVKAGGIIILAWGLGMLILAFKDENSEAKTRAIMVVAVGIVLTTITSIVNIFSGGG